MCTNALSARVLSISTFFAITMFEQVIRLCPKWPNELRESEAFEVAQSNARRKEKQNKCIL